MLLSCPAKKVTKECGIGEALRLGAHLRAKSRALPGCAPKRACGHSRTRAAPFGIPRRALGIRWSTLTGKTCNLITALRKAAAPLPPLCRYFFRYCNAITLRAKNRNIFCPNRIEVKVLQS